MGKTHGPQSAAASGRSQKGRKTLEGSVAPLLLDPACLLLLFPPKSHHVPLRPTARGKLILGRSPGPGVRCLGPGSAPALPWGSGAGLLPLSLISLLENQRSCFPDASAEPPWPLGASRLGLSWSELL